MSPSPIRILHVISSLEGGAGRGVLEMVRRLQQDQRYEVRLCVLGSSPTDLVLESDDPLEFLHAPVHQRSLLFRRLTQLRRLLSRWNPQIVHSHLWPTALTTGLVASRSMPHLIHIRDTPPSLRSSRWGAALRRTQLRRIASNPNVQFVSVSDAAADYTAEALSIDRGRISTILNGIELERFLAVPEIHPHPGKPVVIACAGRLIADKGFAQLLTAISQISLSRDSFRVQIAGTGSAEPALRTLCQELGIADQVQFVGQVADMPAFLAEADLFVHASIAAEGLSRAIIEAQAAGRPVVASDHAGALEAIVDGTTGIVVPAGDSQALAQAIESLMVNSSRLLIMGAVARQRAAKCFTIERVLAEVTGLYTEMLS